MMNSSRIKKLQVLAERGMDGEKQNAKRALERICEKQGISLEALDDSSDKKELHWFNYPRKNKLYHKLLHQCIYKALGDTEDFKYYRTGKKSKVGVYCTKSQAIEIELDFSFYKFNLDKELDRLISTFIQVNDIFPPDVPIEVIEDTSLEDLYLSMSIKKQIPKKAIKE